MGNWIFSFYEDVTKIFKKNETFSERPMKIFLRKYRKHLASKLFSEEQKFSWYLDFYEKYEIVRKKKITCHQKKIRTQKKVAFVC